MVVAYLGVLSVHDLEGFLSRNLVGVKYWRSLVVHFKKRQLGVL